MDLKKAFDKVPREFLFNILYRLGITGKIFRVIKDMYFNNKAEVLLGSHLSPEFDIQFGVMQEANWDHCSSCFLLMDF